ncbi:hypothetical protein B0O99DRAFT_504460 [Bisporella sp. PMI_857]|nr:hypothetical protein B0O99DRAFT_504460 [Bisporella sp. PMI_857]
MAPISPDSLKRGSASQSSDDEFEGPKKKRIRVNDTILDQYEQTLPQTPPPEDNMPTAVSREPLFNDDPHQLLLRSVALALEHVGFDSAEPEALQSICEAVDSYAEHFIAKIRASMLNSRRSQPTPLDFEYALYQFDLPLGSLKPHLKPPVSPAKSQIQLEAFPAEDVNLKRQKAENLILLLGNELNGEVDKRTRPYIPKKFVPFPSKHTYKYSPREDKRERNPRKIREEAAKTARLGEEALRRLVNVSKAGKANDVKKTAEKDVRTKEKHEQWEKLMAAFAVVAGTSSGQRDGEDQSMIVNSEARYFRKGIPAKRKATAGPDLARIEGA